MEFTELEEIVKYVGVFLFLQPGKKIQKNSEKETDLKRLKIEIIT